MPASRTFGETYDDYMSDPTHEWSPRTRLAYVTTRRLAVAVISKDTPVRAITRETCREFVRVLQALPRNASKVYPNLTPQEAVAKSREEGRTDFISPANVNTYLNKLSGVLNWAVRGGIIDRNPASGFRVADQVHRRDKRRPFSSQQLQRIFAAPLYVGCRDDQHGFAMPGPKRPRNARYWVPIIGLYSGMRLNEICQLDVDDVQSIESIACFVVTQLSRTSDDKRLKTASSERVVPLHPALLELGFLDFVEKRRRSGEHKLFAEVPVGATGYRATTFSPWFTRFLRSAGAAASKTCFHSFRHTFRDGLRDARVDREIVMALGGWSSGSSSGISDVYGNGHRVTTLSEELSRLRFPTVDLDKLNDRSENPPPHFSVERRSPSEMRSTGKRPA